MLKARLRLKARIDVFPKVVCQIFEHQIINIAIAVDTCPCAIIFTMIEPSAAPSAARAQAESSKKHNATAKPASKSKHQSTVISP